MNHQKHIPVLLTEVMDLLKPAEGESYLDLTAGYGGHAAAVKKALGKQGEMVLVDRDIDAVRFLRQKFAGEQHVGVLHDDFLAASLSLAKTDKKYDVILADLGVSSQHFNNPDRGFSFNKSGPIDMRMDQRQELTAGEIVNEFSKEDISHILRKYGELRNANQLASYIIDGRPYKDTVDLSKRIARLAPRKRKTDPSTLIFQALRIAVNDELDQLRQALPIWLDLLNPRGRLGVISFHSLEDRIVKEFFKDSGGKRYDARLHILTKKPVMGSNQEIVFNPRARSAKLRAAQRK